MTEPKHHPDASHEPARSSITLEGLEDEGSSASGNHAGGLATDRLRALLAAIDLGFCVIEVIFEGDTPVDYRFLEVNEASSGRRAFMTPMGRTVRELVPQHEAHWFERYGRVASTGVTERFEDVAAVGRYYEVTAFRVGAPGENQVGVLFNDNSDRKDSRARDQDQPPEAQHHRAADRGIRERSRSPRYRKLEFDETLVLYTDALTETRRSGQIFGEQRLLDFLASRAGRSAAEVIDDAVAEVLEFSGQRLRDDLAVLAIRRAPGA